MEGEGSLDICECGFQFGYTFEGLGIQEAWETYRSIWFNEEEPMGIKWLGNQEAYTRHVQEKRQEKRQQLLNIGIRAEEES